MTAAAVSATKERSEEIFLEVSIDFFLLHICES